MKVTEHSGYYEGNWAGKKAPANIAKTLYNSVEHAISVKKEVINHFETQFGYSRDMDVEMIDYNYSFTLGYLDALQEFQDIQNKNGT